MDVVDALYSASSMQACPAHQQQTWWMTWQFRQPWAGRRTEIHPFPHSQAKPPTCDTPQAQCVCHAGVSTAWAGRLTKLHPLSTARWWSHSHRRNAISQHTNKQSKASLACRRVYSLRKRADKGAAFPSLLGSSLNACVHRHRETPSHDTLQPPSVGMQASSQPGCWRGPACTACPCRCLAPCTSTALPPPQMLGARALGLPPPAYSPTDTRLCTFSR